MCDACTHNYSEIGRVLPFIKTDSLHPIHDWQDIYWKQNDEEYDEFGEVKYTIRTLTPKIKVIDGPEVNFKLNSYGFRSQPFDTLDYRKTNILYSGCSNTFGAALPEGMRWTTFLTERFGRNVEEYNVATYGAGIDLCIKNTIGFIKLFGKPDHIFMLLPDVARQTIYSDYAKTYIKASPMWAHVENQNSDPALKDYTINYRYENAWFYNTTLLTMFEEYCIANDINLIWGAWARSDQNIFKNLNYKKYLNKDLGMVRWEESKEGTYAEAYKNKKDMPYWEMAADNMHPGVQWQIFIADSFWEEYNAKNN